MFRQVRGGSRKAVQLRVSDTIIAPMVFGWLRPTLLLPARLCEAPASELRACLVHEWSHLKNGDLLTWNLVRLFQYPLWMQPFYWMLCRRLLADQDFLADDDGVQACTEAADYAQILFRFAQTRSVAEVRCLGMAGRKSQLRRRIDMLFHATRPAHRSNKRKLLLPLVLLTAVMLLGGTLRFAEQTADGRSQTAAEVTEHEAFASEDAASRPQAATEDKEPQETVQITGRFVQESGEPVPDVSIFVWREERRTPSSRHVQSYEIAGDTDGKFSITANKIEEVSLLIRHKDFVSRRLLIKESEDDRDKIELDNIVLKSGFSGIIQVLDKDGRAASDVWVQLYLSVSQEELGTQTARRGGGITDTKYALTNAQGRATFNHLVAGNHVAKVVEQPNRLMIGQELEAKPTKGVYETINVTLSPASWTATIQAAKTINVIVHFSDNQTTPERERRTKITGEGTSVQGVNSVHTTSSVFNGKHLGEGRFSFEVPEHLREARLVLKQDSVGPWVIDNEISYRCFIDGREIQPLSYPLHFPLPLFASDKTVEIKCYKSPKITLHVVDEAGNPIREYFSAALYAKRGHTVTFTLGDEYVNIAYPGRARTVGQQVNWVQTSMPEPQHRLGLDVAFAWRNFGEDTAKVNYEGILPDEELRLYVVAKGYDVVEQVIPKLAEGEERELTVVLKGSSKGP